MTKIKMNCFIASALGHDDVDSIYDYVLKPILTELKIVPLRVDRVEHNEDIDDEIFKLIDNSEICIADLTYARPSVYYEAGYANGKGKPVIYLARRDHFRAHSNDPAGNQKVHFDLQMKNIIPWIEPNEPLKKRLRSRLKHVLSPIIREQQIVRRKREKEQQFNNISQIERLDELLKKAKALVRVRGFSRGKYPQKRPIHDDPSKRDRYYAHFQKNLGKVYIQVHIIVRPAINQAIFHNFPYFWRYPLLSREEYANIKRIETSIFIVALRNSKPSTFATLFPSWTPVSNRLLHKSDVTSLDEEKPHSATIVFIDGVKSLQDFSNRYKEQIIRIEKDCVPQD